LNTGDRAKRDVDGYYFVTGRSNRYVKIFGSRLSLDDIEDFVNGMGSDCACVGSEDLVTVYVCSAELKSSIKLSLSEWTGVNPVGFHVEFIESIPRNSAGKVQYQKLVNAARL
jgi:acyl-coenzyme A synthetase/AMP-(fatty) acid ligase